MKQKRRAITLAGGGPAAGLHIGALKLLKEKGIEFDVWALSCIGAWVGCIYNTFDKDRAPDLTEKFFREMIFREDQSYSSFPVNHAFAPDIQQNLRALTKFVFDPGSYRHLLAPEAITRTANQAARFLTDPRRWNEGDLNNLMLEMAAANPVARYFTAMMFLSEVNGLARIYYDKSSLLEEIGFDRLFDPGKPFLYHNAFNLDEDKIQLFANIRQPSRHEIDGEAYSVLPMSLKSLCACSALPYVEETVEIDGVTYCEGALVETVNFDHLTSVHGDLDEIWVVRIVDAKQIKPPRNMCDGLGNLCMLFAASLGEDNIDIFKEQVRHRGGKPKIVEIPVSHDITFEWNHSNLTAGIERGYESALSAVEKYDRDEPTGAGSRRISTLVSAKKTGEGQAAKKRSGQARMTVRA